MHRELILLLPLALLACDGHGDSVTAGSAGNVTVSAIQGGGDRSPRTGESVAFTGVVTGDFQDNDADDAGNLGGFYVQSEVPDDDPATSEGIFVYDGENPRIDVAVGDRVEIRGIVTEHFGETQVASPVVRVTGSGTVAPVEVALPATGLVRNSDGDMIADLERYEGMLVRFPQTLTVTSLRNLGRFGSVTLSSGGRLMQFTNGNRPDPAGYAAHRDDVARRSLVLDDGDRAENPDTLRYLGTAASLRAGDTVAGLTGNLRYARGSGASGDETWRLMPAAGPAFEASNPRPGAPSVGGNLRVASFNVLNFFSTIDDGNDVCGPDRDQACRGADSPAELDRQRYRTAAALALMDADIVGLTELENNAGASLELVVDTLNTRLGERIYDFVDTGTIGDDAIRTGFIYKTAAVTPIGSHAVLDRSVDQRFDDRRNRPLLAQAFRASESGATLTVAVAHLKSKGSDCDEDGDPNTGDGQGNCNLARTRAAAATASWLASDPTGSGSPAFLLVGDMNAYSQEDPVRTFEDAGLVNLLAGQQDPYSFLFDAQSGALDHAFASPELAPRVVDAIEWHINADEPPVLDYNLEFGRDPSLFDPDSPYRASDHDPVVVGLDL